MQTAGTAAPTPTPTPTPTPVQPEPAAQEKVADVPPQDSGWHFTLTPYLWVPAMNGNLTVNGNSIDIDAGLAGTTDAPDVSLNFALMLHAELSHDRLSLLGDALYLNVEAPEQGPLADVNTHLKLGLYELGVAYSVLDTPQAAQEGPRLSLEPLAGVRIYDVNARLTRSGGALDTSADKTWVDGFVGARARVDFNRTLALFCRGDIGAGGSDLSWSALGGLDIRLCKAASLELGYRALNTDFSSGRGANEFDFDVLLHGPFLAFTFRF